MDEKVTSFNFKARYFTLGELNTTTREVWIVLHGYGQLAKYFSRKFSSLPQHHIYVIAPEGLSRFYLEDIQTRNATGNNRVGATWMTRENRLMDIENYLTYLDKILDDEVANMNIPITILGFSQGVATASRWALATKHSIHRLITWAGVLPPDMNFDLGKERFKQLRVKMIYGSQDPFITQERLMELQQLITKLDVQPDIITYNGGHDIHAETLEKLITDFS